MPQLRKKLPKSQEEMEIARIQREGATASEALVFLLKNRREGRQTRAICESAGISPQAASRIIHGACVPNMYTAEVLAEACGYRLTLEVKNETLNTYVPDDDSYRMRIGDDSLDAD